LFDDEKSLCIFSQGQTSEKCSITNDYCDLLQPRPYSFTYGVKDDFSGTDFSRAEERSGQVEHEFTALTNENLERLKHYPKMMLIDHNNFRLQREAIK
jgi:hypothetical protein